MLLRPRHGVIEPAPVRTESYFSAAEIERARDYRRPQLALYGAVLLTELGVLLVFIKRPPRRLRGPFRRPVLAGAATGAALSIAVSVAVLPWQAVSRERAKDVGLVTQSWTGYARDKSVSWGIGALIAGLGGGRRRRPRAPLPARLVDARHRDRRRVRRRDDLRRPGRARPAVQPVPDPARRPDARRRARARQARRGRRRRRLHRRRQPPHDRRQRLRHGPGHDEARRALRHAAGELHARRGAPRRRPRARPTSTTATCPTACCTSRSSRRSASSRWRG